MIAQRLKRCLMGAKIGIRRLGGALLTSDAVGPRNELRLAQLPSVGV